MTHLVTVPDKDPYPSMHVSNGCSTARISCMIMVYYIGSRMHRQSSLGKLLRGTLALCRMPPSTYTTSSYSLKINSLESITFTYIRLFTVQILHDSKAFYELPYLLQSVARSDCKPKRRAFRMLAICVSYKSG